MNKGNNIYCNVYLSQDMLDRIDAIVFMSGETRVRSRLIRRYLQEGIDKFEAGLITNRKGDYNLILANVKIKSLYTEPSPTKPQKSHYVKKKDRGGI